MAYAALRGSHHMYTSGMQGPGSKPSTGFVFLMKPCQSIQLIKINPICIVSMYDQHGEIMSLASESYN
jgi:hypothetical protein